jgi:hypothetical protein
MTDNNNVAIEYQIKNLENLKREYEIIPAKPKLREGCTVEDLCQEIKINNNQVRVYNNSVDSLIEAFIIEVTSFETVVPEKYKENVLNAAKLRAKNDGNVAMFVYLNEIVGIFNV